MTVRMSLQSAAAPLILDTNVVLDWLVFRHACGAALELALRSGAWRWTVTAAMNDEFDHVLGRGHLDDWRPARAAIDAARMAYATLAQPSAPGGFAKLRCTDADDQKFIDLALQLAPSTLLSRDRAVLKLARRARAVDVAILTPEAWLRLAQPVG